MFHRIHFTKWLLLGTVVLYFFLSWHQSGQFAKTQPTVKGPEQLDILKDIPSFDHKGFTINPLAHFAMEARVLSAKAYAFGQERKLAPVDLALGWGPMADYNVLRHLRVSQRSGWYFYSYPHDSPISRKDISSHSANMHLIPSSKLIEKRIRQTKKDDVIQLNGYLVEVHGSKGWKWRSSLSRTDVGNGACEIIWVEDFKVVSH